MTKQLVRIAQETGVDLEKLLREAKSRGFTRSISDEDARALVQVVRTTLADEIDEEAEAKLKSEKSFVKLTVGPYTYYLLPGELKQAGSDILGYPLEQLQKELPYLPKPQRKLETADTARVSAERESAERKVESTPKSQKYNLKAEAEKSSQSKVKGKQKEVRISEGLYKQMKDKLPRIAYLLYAEGEEFEKPVKVSKTVSKLKEIFGGDSIDALMSLPEVNLSLVDRNSFVAMLARKKRQARTDSARMYLVENRDSFIWDAPKSLKSLFVKKSDDEKAYYGHAPAVIQWIEKRKPEGDTNDLPFYVAVLQELLSPKNIADLDQSAAYWLRVASAVEYVKRDPWVQDNVIGQKLEPEDLLVNTMDYLIKNEDVDSKEKSLEIIMQGLWALGEIDKSFGSARAIQEHYISAAKYVLRNEGILRKIVRDTYKREQAEIKALDKEGENYTDKLSKIIKDNLSEVEKNRLVALGSGPWSSKGDPLGEHYRNRIISLYIKTHLDEFNNSK